MTSAMGMPLMPMPGHEPIPVESSQYSAIWTPPVSARLTHIGVRVSLSE